MAGAGIGHGLCFSVDGGAGGCNVLAAETAAKHDAESGQNGGRIGSMIFLRRKTHLKHASNERRWNAVARDVRNKNRQSIVGGGKEVIEVPSHRCHRLVPRREPEAVKRRRRLRDDQALNSSRRRQLLLHVDKFSLGGQGSAYRDRSQPPNQNKKTDRFYADAGYPDTLV